MGARRKPCYELNNNKRSPSGIRPDLIQSSIATHAQFYAFAQINITMYTALIGYSESNYVSTAVKLISYRALRQRWLFCEQNNCCKPFGSLTVLPMHHECLANLLQRFIEKNVKQHRCVRPTKRARA